MSHTLQLFFINMKPRQVILDLQADIVAGEQPEILERLKKWVYLSDVLLKVPVTCTLCWCNKLDCKWMYLKGTLTFIDSFVCMWMNASRLILYATTNFTCLFLYLPSPLHLCRSSPLHFTCKMFINTRTVVMFKKNVPCCMLTWSV